MSRPRCLGAWLVLAALAIGCTGPDPTPEELELALEDEALELELVSIPVAERQEVVAPPVEVEPEVARAPAARPSVRWKGGTPCTFEQLDEGAEECMNGIAGCAFEIEYEGFPALSEDGTQVVTFEYAISSGADEDVGLYDVVWRRVEDDAELRRAQLANGEIIGSDFEDAGACQRAARQARRAVARVREELREGWHSLPELAVQGDPPIWMSYGDQEELDEGAGPTPAAERPVEAFHRNGWFILRVRGVTVVHKEARIDWLGLPPEMTLDSTVPNIRALHGDAATGVAVVTMDYESASCMSDSSAVFHVVRLAPEAFETIERRAAYVSRYDELPE